MGTRRSSEQALKVKYLRSNWPFWVSKAGRFGKLLATSLLVLVSMHLPSMSAELSVTCVYTALTESYEAMIRCGEVISHDRVNRYGLVRSLLNEFIDKNAPTDKDKISPSYDVEVREEYGRMGAEKVCQNSSYSSMRKFFMAYTAPESVELLRKDLARSRHPNEGECF